MWLDIKNYEGYYQVSSEGKVRRILKDGRTKEVKGRDGVYLTVSLSKDGVKKSHNIHKLVADHFLDKPLGTCDVNHIDGNKHNNRASNLEWCTRSENCSHAYKILGVYPFGQQPRKVHCYDKEGNFIQEFPSVTAAGKAIGKRYARVGITFACQGEYKTAYGFVWKCVD